MTTTTTAQPRIRHTPECRPTAADYVKTRGGKGDLLLRCQSCRQFVVLAPAATRNTPRPTPEHTPKPTPAPVAVVVAEPARPQPWDCPAGWGGMDAGTLFDMEMRFPKQSRDLHRIEWFGLGDRTDQARYIEIRDVRGLPMRGEQAPLRIGQASVRVN